jgi:two-component system, OmpR family, response regulator
VTSPEAPIKVLLVEDDDRLAKVTSRYLEAQGLVVAWARSGPEAITEATRKPFDAMLLDLSLPGRDGIEVCRELRGRTDLPIIMVTARREEVDRVLGFEAGADDYLTKPFSSRELVARIRALVKRARGLVGPQRKTQTIGSITIDPTSMRVTISGREVFLTGHEFAILQVLAERAGRVLSREQLLDQVKGGAEEAFDRSIDIHISRLRQKLGDDARQPRYLKTIRGSGYMLAAGNDE